MLFRGATAGAFFVKLADGRKFRLDNTMVADGALLFLQDLFQANAALSASFYLGVCSLTYDFSTTLTQVAATEPTNGSYARIPLPRDNVTWTTQLIGNSYEVKSKDVRFSATADWNKPWRQVFLTDVAAGTAGHLFAVSGRYPEDIAVVAGQPPVMYYSFALRGLGSEV